MYVVESDFEYRGYRCVTTFGDLGHRCGYVGLPEGHLLYGKNYGDRIPILLRDIQDDPIGKRGIMTTFFASMSDLDENIRLELYFDVHGSLTYSDGGGSYPVESVLWWLGFDCGHYNDGKDLDKVMELWGDDPRIQRRVEIEKEYPIDEGCPIRELDYVQQECRNLVDQIIEYVDKIGG